MTSLTFAQIVQLCSFSLLLACGQLLFKATASAAPPLNSVSAFFGLAGNIWFWIAVSFYGLATLLWIFILQKVDLSLAYPFVALGFVFVPVASWFFFKEPLNWSYAAGVVLLVAALCLITSSK